MVGILNIFNLKGAIQQAVTDVGAGLTTAEEAARGIAGGLLATAASATNGALGVSTPSGSQGQIVWSDDSNAPYAPSLNQWVGIVEPPDVSRNNKTIALGPAPPGPFGYAEGLLFLALGKKLSETPDGRALLVDFGKKYVETLGKCIAALNHASASNLWSNMVNQYEACCIYQRLGLMSAHDAIQTRSWIDHNVGEMLKLDYVWNSMSSLTTLVTSTSEAVGPRGEDYTGLAALAKLFSK